MKLKKIASLMLAGIMAVSMLAACGEGTGNNNGSSSSSETPATGVSAQFGSDMGDPEHIEFTDNSGYNTVLKAYLDAVVNDSNVESYKGKSVAYVGGSDNAVKAYMDRIVDDYLTGYVFDNAINGTFINTNTPDFTIANVFAADGRISQDVVLEDLANTLKDNFSKDNLKPSIYAGGKAYDFAYTCSVSVEKVEASDGLSSAWYVMVVLNADRTVTDGAAS